MINEQQIQRLEKFCKSLINGVDADEKTFDYFSEIDRTLDFETNKQILQEKISKLYPKTTTLRVDELKPKLDIQKKKEDFEEKQEFIEIENDSIKKFDDSIKKIKKEDNEILKEKYEIPKEYIKAVIKSDINSLILLGKAGQGKSFLALKTLNQEKVDYSYHSGVSSPMALYKYLYENKEKGRINVFDDTHGIVSNPHALSILISALYSVSEKRKIMWNTTAKLHIPHKFIYGAKTILITNELPKNVSSVLVNSRCLTYTLDFNWKELIEIMFAIAKTKHKKLSRGERIRIVNWIKEQSDESTENFDLRIQEKIEKLYLYDRTNWEKLSLPLLTKDDRVYQLKRCIESENSIKEACQKWKELTGNGERQFYYLKKRLEQKC